MTTHDEKMLALLEEATDWFLRLRDASGDVATEADFARWLLQSDVHRQAWEKTCRTWAVMGEVAPIHQDRWRQIDDRLSVGKTNRRRNWSLVATALAACLVLAMAGPTLLIWLQADYRTATAETRRITLDDGTVIDMGAGSAISADMAGTTRHVTLLQGEAFFDVAHDEARPFTVDAGGVAVAVIGTAFDVQLSSEETTVELARGIVGISSRGAASKSFELAPGEMAVVNRATGASGQGLVAVEDIGAWRHGRLFVNDVTIGSVIEQLQRYHPAWIKVPDSTLSSRRVTGLYDITDPDRALKALVEPYGGKVHSVSPYLRILARF